MVKCIDEIYQRASKKQGSEAILRSMLDEVVGRTKQQLSDTSDNEYLAELTKAVFKSGFVWKIIDAKWPNFETAFWQFNPKRCAFMSPEDHDVLVRNAGIVRHATKIATVPKNATMVLEASKKHGSFGSFLAQWPKDDFVGLLAFLKSQGARLGGRSAQYFCRFVGYDGFILSRDVVAALINAQVIDKDPNSKSALAAVQLSFNQWQQQTSFSKAQLSRLLALSIDAV